MILDWPTIQTHFERFEGRVPYMYNCPRRVTVGIGHMVTDRVAAQKLTFSGASASAIAEEFDRVAAMPLGRMAQFYRRHGQPLMHDSEINALFRADIESFLPHLARIVSDYERLPGSVRLALLDMIYTLGPTGFSAYKKMLNHLKGRNWKGVALECARDGIPVRGDRHQTIKSMLENPR